MALQNNLNLILELFGLQGKPTHVYSTDIANFGSEIKTLLLHSLHSETNAHYHWTVKP